MDDRKKTFILLSGGCLSEDFLYRCFNTSKEFDEATVICVDKGLEFAEKLGIEPDYIIGDFDSASREKVEKWEAAWKEKKERMIRLNPIKDKTDTHSAILLALELGAEKIYIFGATGGRCDHFLGNINLLMIPMNQNVEAYLMDEQNKIYLKKEGFRIQRADCYGTYISFLPFTEKVTSVTMRGLKYETDRIDMTIGDSLGISNEIASEEAHIQWEKGVFIVVESRD